jgi:16S rRNA G966 N2-methylase RsmD
MRMSSVEKGGYYPLPDTHLPALASLFTPAAQGGKLLDPCAGEGRALKHLAEAWALRPYANELDNDRAAACVRLFGPTQAVHGDLYQLRASTTAFSAVFCNPPYAWDKTGSDKRRELGMLKHSWKWLQPDGWMLWVVYAHHITLDAASYLAADHRRSTSGVCPVCTWTSMFRSSPSPAPENRQGIPASAHWNWSNWPGTEPCPN